MKTSTIRNRILAIAFWVIIWQILSLIIDEEILLVSPITVFARIFDIIGDLNTYLVIYNTFYKMLLGFILGAFFGTILAILSRKINVIYDLFLPVINAIKVVPVASFIILALAWISSRNLSILISFLMVLPIFFTNIYHSFEKVDIKLLQMAKVYDFSPAKKAIYIYLPAMMPIITSSVVLGLSLGLKSAVAAEVIAFSNESIGNMLQEAKVTLEMADVIAWTIILVIFSIMFEKIMIILLKLLKKLAYKRGLRL